MGGPKPGTKCTGITAFSNPRIIIRNEPLGIDWKYDNAQLLNQNRFILEQADNENMTCTWGFGYNQDIVDCLMSPIVSPDQSVNCDDFDKDYPIFEASDTLKF